MCVREGRGKDERRVVIAAARRSAAAATSRAVGFSHARPAKKQRTSSQSPDRTRFKYA